MLNDTQTLGTSGNAAAYVRQYDDVGESKFAVAGLTPNAAQVLRVSHETSNSGKLVGSIVELQHTVVDPNSATGATRVNRVSLLIKRSEFTSAADIKNMIERLKTIVDSSATQDKLLNLEV